MDDFGTCKHGKPFEVCFDCDGAMSDPMEDKRLERSVESLAKEITDDIAKGHISTLTAKNCIIALVQAERDKLRVVEAENEKYRQRLWRMAVGEGDRIDELEAENATLQSQITALNKTHEGVVRGYLDRITALKGEISGLTKGNSIGEAYNHVLEAQRTQLTTIKELLNGASLHPETGVSLVDDVRDLLKEHERALLSRDKALLENTRLREALDKIKYGNQNPRSVDIKSWAYKHDSLVDYIDDVFAKAALEGGK